MKKIKFTKKKIIAVIAMIAAVFSGYKYFNGAVMPMPEPVTVQASVVKESSLSREVNAVGTLVASRSVEITPEAAGHIEKILFKDGAYVEAGSPLIQLDDQTYRTQYESAKAKQIFSENKFKRMVALARKNFVSQQTIDELEADLKERRAQAKESEVMLKRMTLTAPFSGVAGKANVNLGNYVAVGQSLLTLTDTKHLRVEYNVPEKYLPYLKLDQSVALTSVAYPGKTFIGKVAYIAPTINIENRSIAMYADVPNDDGLLKAGMFVTISQSLGSDEHTLAIPARSLMPIMDGEQVYKVVEGKAVPVKVIVGKRTDDLVQIVNGLSSGDIVITDGQLKVQPGMPVKIKS